MKALLLALTFLACGTRISAQLFDGSVAQEMNITAYQPALIDQGLHGNGTYSLYEYLNLGYTVYIDFSATWCWPCWNYHTTGALEELYRLHGPLLPGHPGVDPSSTNDVMVFFVEMDGDTGGADMFDGYGDIGNWINPTGNEEVHYPMANPGWTAVSSIAYNFDINGYPTIYRICPNRFVMNSWSSNVDVLYEEAESCPVVAGTVNPYLFDGNCASQAKWLRLQNLGSAHLTEATLQVKQNGNVIHTLNWTGDLPTYQWTEILTDQLIEGDYTVEIVSQDDVPEPGINAIDLLPVWITDAVTIEVTTDSYGNESTWFMGSLISANAVTPVASGGPYEQVPSPGTMVQQPVTVELDPDVCYSFAMIDDFGDGMNSGFGEGSFRVKDDDGQILFQGGVFEDYTIYRFRTAEASLALAENAAQELTIYPNPASEAITLAFVAKEGDYETALIDLQGRTVFASVYRNLSGEQQLTLPVSNVAPGNYLVRLTTDGSATVKTVVIR